MSDGLPDTHDISVEIDGTRFDGAWSNVLGEMVVYYNGFTSSAYPKPDEPDAVAKDMLRQLVHEHYLELGTVSESIPEEIRQAAHLFMNADMDDELDAIEELVQSFGQSAVDSLVYQQLAWLCVNSLSMIVPFWKQMCDDGDAEPAYTKLREKLLDVTKPMDIASLTTPFVGQRNGMPVADCDACRLAPTADAIAHTAAFMQTGESDAAVSALWSVYNAYEEGCHLQDAPERFSQWLVLDVLQRSLECRPVEGMA